MLCEKGKNLFMMEVFSKKCVEYRGESKETIVKDKRVIEKEGNCGKEDNWKKSGGYLTKTEE